MGLLHWDGEFTSAGDLIKSTYTGRNFGWLPGEQAEARRHFAKVIREDAGRDKLAQEYGGLSYAVLLRGVDAGIPEARRLPTPLRFDPMLASDDEIINGCARLVALYLESLQFSRDSGGRYDGSPYDAFLAPPVLARPRGNMRAVCITRLLRCRNRTLSTNLRDGWSCTISLSVSASWSCAGCGFFSGDRLVTVAKRVRETARNVTCRQTSPTSLSTIPA
jgi:hypothetical protein